MNKKSLFKYISLSVFINSSVSIADNNNQTNHIIPDQNKPQTLTIDNKNIDTVNINPADKGGLSHNYYIKFNIDEKGLILNNKKQDNIPAAKMIISEVTSKNPSYINGIIEIAGEDAHHLIVNPNGISCNGCGFTNETTLVSGKLIKLNQGDIKGVSYNRKAIIINNLRNERAKGDLNIISNNIKFSGRNINNKNINIYSMGSDNFNKNVQNPELITQRRATHVKIKKLASITSGGLFIRSDHRYNIKNYGLIDVNELNITSKGHYYGAPKSKLRISSENTKQSSILNLRQAKFYKSEIEINNSALMISANNLSNNNDIEKNNQLRLTNSRLYIGGGFDY
ncbi:filamentous hemagglutinin N-terminal domain-containing protein [Moellerella wisconsensis]|uniref:Filamentous hemagglutinin N-terminal domain-containing protein n=1 Tax=Moellerella wisconsensis TaxID=158849 RepID=A0ACD3Y794_9GAMM|nr:filamentous hemagglutinin N-terminal domain-containing protein [Moellerella wisconsensis]UNH37961.1 filamentous hemagglutinin N-terminal domain-containing protein [Moellerella wisconsensis]